MCLDREMLQLGTYLSAGETFLLLISYRASEGGGVLETVMLTFDRGTRQQDMES